MDTEIWQQLLSLESRDVVTLWFERIHGRQLNERRAKEIAATAKQAREYFRNAAASNYSVRPLLTFYGVASLGRAILLLLKAKGGEEGLAPSHGLQTVDWRNVLSGDVNSALAKMSDLKITTCAGLFSDFLCFTKNRLSIHINSGAVDWRLSYDIPKPGREITVLDLLSRIPDLQKDLSNICSVRKFAYINEMTFSEKAGFQAKVISAQFLQFQKTYEELGYCIADVAGLASLTCDFRNFVANPPQLIHSYVHKTFGSIPALHIAEPFSGGVCYSQLCITYMVSYILGMLVRYFPTHWISLIQGDRGDSWWPTFNRAQQFVEASFPELAIELIMDILDGHKLSYADPKAGKLS